jgi:hypothetical protein
MLIALLAVGISSTIYAAKAQQAQAAQQSKMFKYNAAVQTAQAQEARKAAAYEAAQKREEGRKLHARQLTLYSKAGVLPQVGTPLLTMAETAADVERDARVTEITGKRQGRYYESQAGLSRMQASAVTRAGRWGAGTTLLTGIANVGMSYYAMNSMSKVPSVSPGFSSTAQTSMKWLNSAPKPYW